MDSRLEMVRPPAEPASRTATVGGNRTRATGQAVQQVPTASAPVAKAGTPVGEDRVSVDPMRATDRYRLVMPYSLRV